jgi:hypothetical protein
LAIFKLNNYTIFEDYCEVGYVDIDFSSSSSTAKNNSSSTSTSTESQPMLVEINDLLPGTTTNTLPVVI